MSEPKYIGFDPDEHGDYFIGIELMADTVEEIFALNKLHWKETEHYKAGNITPNYTHALNLEREGKFALFTVRSKETRDIVGYLQYYIFQSVYQPDKMEAREDAFFLHESARGGGLASHLLAYAVKTFREMGVDQMGMSSKEPSGGANLDGFLRRQGFTPVAIFYYKDLNDTGEV